eukprot:s670_g22.t1
MPGTRTLRLEDLSPGSEETSFKGLDQELRHWAGDAETEGTDAAKVLVPSTEIVKLTGAGEKGVSPSIPSAAKVTESKAKDAKTSETTAPAAPAAPAAKATETTEAKAPAAKAPASGEGGKPAVAKAAKTKPAPVSTAKTISLESLKILTDMGFDETAATTALEASAGNVDQAVVMLSAAATAAPKPPRKRQLKGLQEKVNTLTAMGFSEQQAKDALDASDGDVESAVEILTGRAA